MGDKSYWPTRERILRPAENNPVRILKAQAKIGNKQFPGLNAVLEKEGHSNYVFYIGKIIPILALETSKTKSWYPVTVTAQSGTRYKVPSVDEFKECIRMILHSPETVRYIAQTINPDYKR